MRLHSGRRVMVARISLAGALLAGLLAAAPVTAEAQGRVAPTGQREPSTPQLIDRAVASGEISSAEGLRLLAYALFQSDRVPDTYRSTTPWHGTVPLLEVQEGLADLPPGPLRDEIAALVQAPDRQVSGQAVPPGDVQANAETPPDGVSRACSTYSSPTTNIYTTTHFYIEYRALELTGDLDIVDYANSLEGSWTKQLDTFGWARPPVYQPDPAPGNRYHVRLEPLGLVQLGFTTSDGRHAGLVGNNPSTPWAELDSLATCIVLNSNFGPAAGPGQTEQQVLDATTSHEFNHAIQIGYGALTGDDRPDLAWIEGLATWMEDETYDNANYADFYLWPAFDQSAGSYPDADPYPFWITFRGLTERFGTGVAGGAENAAQEFWERLSQYGVTGAGQLMLDAMHSALAGRGVSLADAFHHYAIAVKFVRTCGGGYVLPYCFQEAAQYIAAAGVPPVHRQIINVGQSTSGSVRDNYAINWVRLPTSGDAYRVTLQNTAAGGQLRGSIVCDNGSNLRIVAMPAVVASGATTSVPSFDSAGCNSVVLVITNQVQTAANPSTSALRSYSVSTSEPPVLPQWRGGVVRGNQWFLRDAPGALPTGVANTSFVYGDAGDRPLMCDWDGDSLRTPGIHRGFTFHLRDSVSSGQATRPAVPYGNFGDRPICGDWDGDGVETVGVVRGTEFFLKGNNTPGSAAGDQRFVYGNPGDVPIVGDWDGDGDTDIGIRRGIVFYLRTGTGAGFSDLAPFAYGDPGDIPFASDPDRDGRWSVGVHRRGQWFLRQPAASSTYGDPGDFPVIWFVPA